MKIIKAKDYEDMSRKAANIISAQVILKPDCVLGLATGSTPIGAYKQLAAWYKKGDVDFAEVSTYNLDEYRGLSHDDPQSYHYFMRENFFDHINICLLYTSAVSGMAQVNVRVDRSVKERAEEALQLSGRSLPELIKNVVAKVAQGGGQCEEVLAAVDDRRQTVAPDTPFAASWAAADQLYADLGIARCV